MRGSSQCVTIGVTTVLIVVLSLLTMALAMFYQQTKINSKRELYVYAIFFVIYVFGTCLSLQKLHRCARTDPGFIPSEKVLKDSIMTHKTCGRLKDDKSKHYVQYMERKELDESFKANSTNPNESMMFADAAAKSRGEMLHRYFSTNKFKYYNIPLAL